MDVVLQNLQNFYAQYLQPLIAQLLYISVKFQVVLTKIPVVGSVVKHIPIYPFEIAFYIVLFALIASLVNFLVNFRSNSTRRKVKRFYGISDLSRFKVHPMGKTGSKYYQNEITAENLQNFFLNSVDFSQKFFQFYQNSSRF